MMTESTMAKQTLRRDFTLTLLTLGTVAGPMYIFAGLFQILIRPGFDITRHDLSLLSNGELGWIQVLNFLLTGLFVVAAAVGMNRVLKSGLGNRFAPIMIGLFGLGMIGAGLFSADPVNGFPPGIPSQVTTHGILHFVTGGIGFLGFITACFIFARRFASLHERQWSRFSFITGLVFLFAFIGIAVGSQPTSPVLSLVTLAFWGAIILGFSWLSALCIHLQHDHKIALTSR